MFELMLLFAYTDNQELTLQKVIAVLRPAVVCAMTVSTARICVSNRDHNLKTKLL